MDFDIASEHGGCKGTRMCPRLQIGQAWQTPAVIFICDQLRTGRRSVLQRTPCCAVSDMTLAATQGDVTKQELGC